MADEQQTLGEEIIDWIQATCRVPEGALVGRPLELMDWQKHEILRIYDNPAVTRRAIISVARKSGKTSLAACLLLAHLAGPAAIPNSQMYSAAQSRDQAALLYALAAKIVRPRPFSIPYSAKNRASVCSYSPMMRARCSRLVGQVFGKQ